MSQTQGKPLEGKIRISPAFVKILAIFLIVLTPVYLVGLCVNFIGQRELREKTVLAAVPKIEDCVRRLEKDVELARNSLMKLHVSPELRQLSTTTGDADGYQRMRSILYLSARMGEIADQSEFIGDIHLFIPLMEKKLTTQGNRDMNWNEFLVLQDIGSKGIYPFCRIGAEKILELPKVTRKGIDTYMTLMPFHSMVTVRGVKVPQYIIAMRMDRDALQGMLRELADTTGGEGYLIPIGNGLTAATGESDSLPVFWEEAVSGERVNRTETVSSSIRIGGITHLALSKHSDALETTFLSIVRQDSFLSSLSRYRVWLWIATGLAVVMAILFTLLVRTLFITPLRHLVDGFAHVEQGELSIRLDTRNHDEFRYLFHRFNEMCANLAKSIDQIYAQRILMQRAELRQLQYQINPHFLYNSLFIVYRMAKLGDMDSVMKLSLHLGGYYRFVTKGAADETTWQEEAAHVADYVEIQTIRFASRIHVDFQPFPTGMLTFPVPRLVLQPLVENAFNHGLSRKTADGLLRIHATMLGNALHVVVEDNGEDLDDVTLNELSVQFLSEVADDSAGTTLGGLQEDSVKTKSLQGCENALMNIHNRIRIRFGADSGLSATRSELGGLRMELRILMDSPAAT